MLIYITLYTHARTDEVRIDRPGSVVYVALASEGSSLVSEDLLVQGVLQHAMGTGNHLKRGSNTVTSKLNKAATSASGGPCVVRTNPRIMYYLYCVLILFYTV